jgi:hypothetical protein
VGAPSSPHPILKAVSSALSTPAVFCYTLISSFCARKLAVRLTTFPTTISCYASNMNQEVTLRILADTENRAALGDRQIAYQRARIEHLERVGRGLREAKALLTALEDCQRVKA